MALSSAQGTTFPGPQRPLRPSLGRLCEYLGGATGFVPCLEPPAIHRPLHDLGSFRATFAGVLARVGRQGQESLERPTRERMPPLVNRAQRFAELEGDEAPRLFVRGQSIHLMKTCLSRERRLTHVSEAVGDKFSQL